MNDFKDQVSTSPSITVRGFGDAAWRVHLFSLVTALLVLVAAYWPTFHSMVSIWIRSETFAHGFFVFPISIWLIYRMRADIAKMSPRVDWWAVSAGVCCGITWMLGHAAGAHVVQQYAAVAFIPTTIWLLLGRRIAWQMAFPLGFMLMAVPAGEVFIPKLMHFTAWFTTLAIRLTGIPVFRDGMSITLPHGSWAIATACSGIRYLMAMLTVGLLFGYLSYRSWWRRTAFAGIALIVAVIGNGLRAYGIVMIGYLSNMRYANGADHIVYGWVFFGILVVALLGLGEWWREPEYSNVEVTVKTPNARRGYSAKTAVVGLSVALAAIVFWPVTVALRAPTADGEVPLARVPSEFQDWSSVVAFPPWKPEYTGYASLLTRTYRKGSGTVGMYLAWYPVQTQGRELISSTNLLVSEKNTWKVLNRGEMQLKLRGHAIPIETTILRSGEQDLLVWHSYWIAGRWASNPFYAKLLQSLSTMVRGDQRGAALFLYTSVGRNRDRGRDMLRDFLKNAMPGIEHTLESSRPDRG